MPSMAQRVDAPIPLPPVLSLPRSSLSPPVGNVRDWAMGIRFLPEANVQVVVDDFCNASTTIGSYTNPTEVEQNPIVIIAYDRCTALSSFGRDYAARATRLIDAATPKAVEKEFWKGTLAQAKSWTSQLYLQKSTATNLTPSSGGVAVSVNRAMGMLEQALADCGFGGQGMIHAKVELTPNFTMVRRDGNLLRTVRDTIVVPGVGYDGTGPTNVTGTQVLGAGETYLYATGITEYRQTDPDLFPTWPSSGTVPQWAIDRATNTITVPVARTAMVSWDGQCHFAVKATLPT